MSEKYRIIEEIDGTGESLFYPERKGWFGWSRFYGDCCSIYFYEKKRAVEFIKKQLPVKTVIHGVE